MSHRASTSTCLQNGSKIKKMHFFIFHVYKDKHWKRVHENLELKGNKCLGLIIIQWNTILSLILHFENSSTVHVLSDLKIFQRIHDVLSISSVVSLLQRLKFVVIKTNESQIGWMFLWTLVKVFFEQSL